ncbi:hypothetical protein K438DRAFT_1658426 [Mycena galopus ATCC 62051]|nr:hypothetical protein K438DRAFT_1658426 [Mycena galopus ATCC 62051]
MTSSPSQCSARSPGRPSTGQAFDASVSPASGTRYYALLKGNEPPEESEATVLWSIVSKTDTQLADLDDEIFKLREKLSQSEEQRASLFSYRTQNSAILSPLRRMPPELLREIFSSALPAAVDLSHQRRWDIGQAPWLLTHVSSRWRAVALSTPSLWSHIVVNYCAGHDVDFSLAYPPAMMEAQLERSQNLKINFSGDTKLRPDFQVQMFELLAQHSLRWEELSVGLTFAMTPVLTTIRHRIPSLQRLYIHWSVAPEDPITKQALDCFQTAPSLVDVSLLNTYHGRPVSLPVHLLTRYEQNCPLEDHRRILTQTPNLIEAHIWIEFDDEPWPDFVEAIDLVHLQRLYVSNVHVLKHFRLPALEELAVIVGYDAPHLLPSFTSLLDRSSCSLRRLCLRECPAATVIQLLQTTPSFTELFIVDQDDTDESNTLIAALTVSGHPKSTPLAPHLRLVYFGCEYHHHIDSKAYLDMLKSRLESESCALETAGLFLGDINGPDPDVATVRGLLDLRQQGILVVLEGEEALSETETWDYRASWN